MGVDHRHLQAAHGLDKGSLNRPVPAAAQRTRPYSGGVKIRHPLPSLCARAAALLAGLATAWPAAAQGLDTAALGAELQRWTLARADAAEPRPGARVSVTVGQLDPRLKLAPCTQIEPYLPTGSRPWGRTRVGLRCTSGPSFWNVFMPVTVQVHAVALVLREPLPAGTVLTEEHLTEAEVDWAERPAPPLTELDALLGRSLARPMAAGEALRDNDLQRTVWFAAGERVKVTALGRGYRVSVEGQALSRGLDGQPVRVRTEGGKVISGKAVAPREVEITL